MRIGRLRNKLLLSVTIFIVVVTLVSMSVVSWVIGNQYLDQSETQLNKAIKVISDNLRDRGGNMLLAARQLASQRNLGSTLWYLGKYAAASDDRAMLEMTYQQIAKDTYKIGYVAKFNKIAIYDATGMLVSFANREHGNFQVGYARMLAVPRFYIAKLQAGDDINPNNIIELPRYGGFDFHYPRELPTHEQIRYAVHDGKVVLESYVPIMGEVFKPQQGDKVLEQFGFVVAVQELDPAFIEHLSVLTEVKIDIFSDRGLSLGSLPGYNQLQGGQVESESAASALQVVQVGDAAYYQKLMTLKDGDKRVATIATLQSKQIVQSNILEMMRTLGLIAIASLLFIFPFIWYFVTSITKPLRTLSRIFHIVASGEQNSVFVKELLSLEKEKLRNDELGDLTKSFILMSDAVREKMGQNEQLYNELKKSRDELEYRVEERTKELVALKQNAERMARTDQLTGLPNRRAFYEQAALIIAQAYRYGQPLTLVMLDIDHFKGVNDTHGHDAGDVVLKAVADQIDAAVRTSDVPARQGGEEFVILLPMTDLDEAVIFSERLRAHIAALDIAVHGEVLKVTCSFGIAMLSKADEDIDALLKRSDAALYLAKDGGRNQVKCDMSEMSA